MPVVSGSLRPALFPPPPPPHTGHEAAAAAAAAAAAWQPPAASGLLDTAWTAFWVVLTIAVSFVSARLVLAGWQRQQRVRRSQQTRPHPPGGLSPSLDRKDWAKDSERLTGHPSGSLACEDDRTTGFSFPAVPTAEKYAQNAPSSPTLAHEQHRISRFQQQQQEKNEQQQLRDLQQQQGLFSRMAAPWPPVQDSVCGGGGSGGYEASRGSTPPPPPPLTAPSLSASIFRLDKSNAAASAAASIAPSVAARRDDIAAQLAFMHQPNPDYMSVDLVDLSVTDDTAAAAPAVALPRPNTAVTTAASTSTAGIASGRRSASGSPRLRNYAKIIPVRGGNQPPMATAAASAAQHATMPQQPYPWQQQQQQQQQAPVPWAMEKMARNGTMGEQTAADREIDVHGEIIAVLDDAGAGWKRHTRVYGGGVCLACLEAEKNGGDDSGGAYGENVPMEERRY